MSFTDPSGMTMINHNLSPIFFTPSPTPSEPTIGSPAAIAKYNDTHRSVPPSTPPPPPSDPGPKVGTTITSSSTGVMAAQTPSLKQIQASQITILYSSPDKLVILGGPPITQNMSPLQLIKSYGYYQQLLKDTWNNSSVYSQMKVTLYDTVIGSAVTALTHISQGNFEANDLLALASIFPGEGFAELAVVKLGLKFGKTEKALNALAKIEKFRATKNVDDLATVGNLTKPLLLGAPKEWIQHHIFNAFRGNSPKSQVYRDFFKRVGINVDDFTVIIPKDMHVDFIHKAGNNWTTRWKQFIDANPNATAKEAFQFGGKLMDEYGLSGLQIIPY